MKPAVTILLSVLIFGCFGEGCAVGQNPWFIVRPLSYDVFPDGEVVEVSGVMTYAYSGIWTLSDEKSGQKLLLLSAGGTGGTTLPYYQSKYAVSMIVRLPKGVGLDSVFDPIYAEVRRIDYIKRVD